MAYELLIDKAERVLFSDKGELALWAQNESKTWGWTVTVAGEIDDNFQGILNDIRENIFAPVSGIFSTRDIENKLEDIQNRIDEGKYIPTTSKIGRFIFNLRKTDNILATKVLWLSLQPPTVQIPTDGQTLSAFISLLGLRQEHSIEHSLLTSKTLVGKHQDILISEEKLALKFKEEQQSLIDNVKKELADFKQTIKEEIALKEPIHYWTEKAAEHEKAKNRWGILLTIYSVTVLILLASFILRYDDSIKGFIASWKDAGLGAVASFAGLIGIGMVIARVLYRLFASQLHLWNDARERVTMIQTYLALAAEGHAKEEFLGALMQRLFSPSVDGIVKSELGAVGVMDAVARNLGQK